MPGQGGELGGILALDDGLGRFKPLLQGACLRRAGALQVEADGAVFPGDRGVAAGAPALGGAVQAERLLEPAAQRARGAAVGGLAVCAELRGGLSFEHPPIC